MGKQRFEYAKGSSAKFWEVEANGETVTVSYGRIGTGGQTKTKDHGSPAAARAAMAKLIGQKTAKGYTEVAAGSAASTAKPAKPAKKASKKPTEKGAAKKVAKKTAQKTAQKAKFSKLALKRIFKAIERGSTKELTSALAKGLDPNAKDPDYDRPLFQYAVGKGQLDVALLLLDHGASTKSTDSYRQAPLHCAVQLAGAEALVARLLEAGADVHAKSNAGRTPLFECRPELMGLLVDAGAAIDEEDRSNNSPYGAGDVAQRRMLRQLGARGFEGAGGRVLSPTVNADPNLDEIYRTECIGKAADGAIWLGSYAGYHRFGPEGVTQYVFQDSFSPDSFASGKDGAIYFGTNWGLLEHANDTWTLYQPSNSEIHDGHIVDIASDPEGRVYCLAYNDPHVSVFDGGSWTLYRPGHELPGDFQIKRMGFADDGSMLLGSDRSGARMRVGDAWKPLKLHDKALGTPTVYDFATMDGAIYVGCLNGIVRIDGDESTHFEPSGVSLITALAPAGDGELWASGNYDGLVRLADDELSYFREEDQELLDGSIDGLVVDDRGLLWMHDGKTVLTFDGDQVRKAGGLTFAEAHPELAEKRAKQKARAAKKKATEKKSKHVRSE